MFNRNRVGSKSSSLRTRARLSRFPRFRFFVKYILPVLSFIVAAAGLYISYVKYVKPWLEEKKLCWEHIGRAEQLARQDKFDEALASLSKGRKSCAAAWIRDDDVLRARLEAVKTATEFDQIKRVSKKDLSVIEEDWGFVDQRCHECASTMELKGIIEELHYRPDKAIEQYKAAIDKDQNYVAAHIRLGYVYFKWKLEGSNWETKALGYFDEAANVAAKSDQESDRKNAWPHISKAAVYLSQAQSLLGIKCPDPKLSKCDETQDVRAKLAQGKSSLEEAVKLVSNDDNPRLHLLWGHYYALDGFLIRAAHLGDPARSYYDAETSLGKAITLNPNIADVHLLLATVYEELSENKTSPAREEYNENALEEYGEAVRLDGCNILARSAYAQALFKQKRLPAAAEQAKEGITLIEQFVKDLDERFQHVDRDDIKIYGNDIKDWLKKTREEYSGYLGVLRPIAQAYKSKRATTMSAGQENPACQ
jgi:tetratricopeptide (TPR) repeat protein